jgi:hypothetical protein
MTEIANTRQQMLQPHPPFSSVKPLVLGSSPKLPENSAQLLLPALFASKLNRLTLALKHHDNKDESDEDDRSWPAHSFRSMSLDDRSPSVAMTQSIHSIERMQQRPMLQSLITSLHAPMLPFIPHRDPRPKLSTRTGWHFCQICCVGQATVTHGLRVSPHRFLNPLVSSKRIARSLSAIDTQGSSREGVR